MRTFLAVALLALASCGSNTAANNAAVNEAGDTGDVTAVNDTTAIDAATGDAANMAADVNYSFNEEADNTAGNDTAPSHEPDEPGMTNNAAD
jgi:hypothetical protein